MKTNPLIKKRGYAVLQYVLSFVIPFLVITLAYIGLHIAPFGNKTIVISDAKVLCMSDLSYAQRAFRGQEDLLYSFQQGIGMSLIGTIGIILNPINLIVLLFDITSFASMYSWRIAIDMAFCGLTMFVFLSSVYGRKTHNLIFSTVYALIGYNVAYCFLCGFAFYAMMLPLIALGIRKIIDGKSPWLYLISLAYTILLSYYFGYMLCIASFVLFLMWYAENRKDYRPIQKKRIWVTYFGSSMTAGFLSAFIWIPSYISIIGGRANQNSILDFSMADNMSFSDAFAKLFIGANNTDELVSGKPNIFCGALVVFLVIAFFIDRRNLSRSKAIRGVPLIFYFVTFYVKAFSMIMQGFSVTNWFNYRYSFIFCFLLIITAFEEFLKIREIEAEDLKRSCFVFGLFVVMVFAQKHSFVSGGWMTLDVVILAGCIGAIWWNRIDAVKAPHRVMAMLLILLCSIEGYANYMVSTNKILEWGYNDEDYRKELFNGSVIADAVNGADPSFYRMVNEHPTLERCNNDPRLFAYNGVNYFGSYSRDFIFQGMSRFGLPWWSNRMWYAKGMPDAFDALFGIKYVVSEQDLAEDKGYEKKGQVDKYSIFLNHNALPIGLLVKDTVDSVKLERDPFENHNHLWKQMTGQNQDVFTKENDISFTFHANYDGEQIDYESARQYSASVSKKQEEESGAKESASEFSSGMSDSVDEATLAEQIIDSGLYIECVFTAAQDGSIYSYAGAGVDDNSGYGLEAIHYLGNYKKGDKVSDYIYVNSALSKNMFMGICGEYYAAYANTDVLTEYCSILQSGAGELVKIAGSHLTGKIEVKDNNRLFFTIPYDEGWTLKIDGVKTELEKTADLFISGKVAPGIHEYELTFFPMGMKDGIMISGGAVILLLLLIAYVMIGKRKSNTVIGQNRDAEKEETPIENTIQIDRLSDNGYKEATAHDSV